MPHMRSISSALILLLTAVPTIGMAQQEKESEQAEAQQAEAEQATQEMMQRMQERVEAMGQMRTRKGHMGQMHDGMGHMGRMMAYAPPHLLERRDVLALTDDQVSGLEALAKDLKTAHEKAETDSKAHRTQLMEAWKADKPDVGQLRSHAKAAMAAEQAEHLAMLTAVARAKALLSPEQRGRVEGWGDAGEMMRDRMMGGGMMGRHMMGGGMMGGHEMSEHGMRGQGMHDKESMHPQPDGSR